MNFYMVVQIDSEGMFIDEPEYFDLRSEAESHHKRVSDDRPDLEFSIFDCQEIHRRDK